MARNRTSVARRGTHFYGRQPTYEEALAEAEYLEGTKVIEWDRGLKPVTDWNRDVRREHRPTGRTGVIEIWRPNSKAPARLAAQNVPSAGAKTIRLLKKDGSPALSFIEIMPPRRDGVRYLPTGWKVEGSDPNASDPYRSKLAGSGVDESVPAIVQMRADHPDGPQQGNVSIKRSGGIDLRAGIGLSLTAMLLCLIMTNVISPGSVALLHRGTDLGWCGRLLR